MLRRAARIPALAAAAPALALVLAACEGSAPPEQHRATAIAVTDDAGAQVRLAAPAQRVVSLLPYLTEFVVALGAADRLVARTDYDLDPRLAELPSVGGGLTPSVEFVVSLRPDVVFAWPDSPSRSVVGQMQQMGIPVYQSRHGRLSDVDSTLAEVGRMLGREAAADSLARAIGAELDTVRARVAGRPTPTVMYLVARDPLMTAGGTTYIHDEIIAAGGRNVFGDLPARAPVVSLEEVVRRQPDRLVVPREESGPGALGWLRSQPGWSELEAVRQGRVLEVDGGLFGRPGPEVGRAVRTLAAWLHPEAFPGEPAGGGGPGR